MAAELATLMNDSLSPTRANPRNPISPSNYPDKKSVVAAYKRMVMTLIESQEDRIKLQRALREFNGSLLVEDLMEKLRPLLNMPKRRQLYLAIRPLIPPRVRSEYNSYIPHIPNFEKKIVHMKQQGNRSLGFSIRGGIEFGCGVYVTSVLPSSKAAQAGLKMGDEIVRVNGLTLSQSTHEETVNLIKLKKTLTLTVRVVGIIPNQNCFGKIEWKTITNEKRARGVNPTQRLNTAILRSTKKIQVMLDASDVLGASIKTSNDPQSGVFITELIPNSIAHNSGLKIGDEIVEVNGCSLLNKPHQEAIKLLKSSNSLMLTVRNKDPSIHHDPLAEPPEDFELSPHDFDIDAEMMQTDLNASTMGFVLRKAENGQQLRVGGNNQPQLVGQLGADNISSWGMEAGYSKIAPMIASPAAEGWGPTVAMPTLMGMMPEMPSFDESANEQTFLSISQDKQFNPRESVAFPDIANLSNETAVIPPSIASVFPQQLQLEEPKVVASAQKGSLWNPSSAPVPPPPPPSNPPPPPAPNPPVPRNMSGQNFASYQFPVDDDDEGDPPLRHTPPDLTRQPSASALKKSLGTTKKTPAFKESVEIISVQGANLKSNSANSIGDTVHPSNMEFSDAILKGRDVAFHTVPKDGSIKIAIRGGTDTPLGGSIIISRILEGGAADRYGKLNVGDQILVCDGVSLLEVTHNEAAQALKRAMDMESKSIDLVVAVNPDAEARDKDGAMSPKTMWPPPEDTVCEDQPAGFTQYDYAKSSHRAHSGFTLRGKEGSGGAHSFLPKYPK